MWRVRLAACLLLAGCAAPAPADRATPVSLGTDGSGLACTQQVRPNGEALIYCGDLRQPSGRIVVEDGRAEALGLAMASRWRSGLDRRFACHPPRAEPLLGTTAAVLDCSRRASGWPRIAIAVVIDGRAYLGDADPAAGLVLRRGIGVAAGRLAPATASAAPIDAGLAATRAAAEAVSSRDIRDYETLMAAGVRANLTEAFAASEAAFRQAAALQLRYQGPDAPARADPLLHEALQLSNLARFAESDALFATAEQLLVQAQRRGAALPDPTVVPRLALYRGLSLLNQGQPAAAMAQFDLAERGFAPLAPPPQRIPRPAGAPAARGIEAAQASIAEAQLFQDPIAAAAVLGRIAVRRSRAIALLMQHQPAAAAEAAEAARQMADAHGMSQSVLDARLLRTSAMVAVAQGEQGRALTLLDRSAAAFGRAFPGSRPFAETELLRAAVLFREKDAAEGLRACRRAIAVLQKLGGSGVATATMMPCLDGFAAAAAADPARADALRADAFLAAQFAQSTLTSAQIAQSAARLAEAQRDTRVGAAIRRRDEAVATLDRLYRALDAAEDAARRGATLPGPSAAALAQEVEHAEAAEAEADSALGAAAPNYSQLVQGAVTAPQVFAALRPDEALVAIVLGADHGWSYALRDGRIALARVPGTMRAEALVAAIRQSVQAGPNGVPPPFASDAAAALYAATLAPVAGALDGVRRLVVAPSGPLLSIPFGLLLRGPAGPDLATAPFLARSLDLAHVPAPANFVSLRRVAGGAQGRVPWIGVADPVPVTLRQARASFPGAGCRDSAAVLSGLPPLPGTRTEIDLVRQALGGDASHGLVGAAFTRTALLRQPIGTARVLQFATHGLLPTDLACQDEPALLASPAPGATDAASALITASQIAQWTLDADAVILSACNTSGPDGRLAGESLSGLARSFFYAGARGLLVTHWPVNDRVTAVLVAGTMQHLRADPGDGLAAALAAQQRALLAEATGPLAGLAHPFYWASLALVGDGSGLSAGL